MDKSDRVNGMIDAAIKGLSDGDINQGADELEELANMFAKAGAGMQSFLNIRKHIIQEAEKKTDKAFIREKLKLIERRNQNGRRISNQYSH